MTSKRRVPSILGLLVVISTAGVTPTMAQAAAERPSWGGSDRVLHAIGDNEFSPHWSSDTYQGFDIGRYSTVTHGTFKATPHIPSGVLLTYLELDYCDNSVADDVTLTFADCNYVGQACAAIETLFSSSGATGCNFVSVDLTPHNYTVDNNLRRLVLVATTESGTSDTTLVGAYLGYKLQVSPAPGAATFNDVPTNHPFFRFIEALADSGITAGCGGGNFCPDQPLTRGQMAVFLSIALGLHFPN